MQLIKTFSTLFIISAIKCDNFIVSINFIELISSKVIFINLLTINILSSFIFANKYNL